MLGSLGEERLIAGIFIERDDGNHFTAPTSGGPPHDDRVTDRRVVDQGSLDLFNEDFLTPGVDGHRVATKQHRA